MKRLLILGFVISLSSCGGTNDDGSSKSTYSSCLITQSQALLAGDRANDLNQCWNAEGDGYETKSQALQWCRGKVNAYIANRYILGHTVTLVVESTNCP